MIPLDHIAHQTIKRLKYIYSVSVIGINEVIEMKMILVADDVFVHKIVLNFLLFNDTISELALLGVVCRKKLLREYEVAYEIFS